jgi:hypothetical protein
MMHLSYTIYLILFTSLFILLTSCNSDVTEVYEGTTVLYSTSFEAPTDTIGWSYVYPMSSRYSEGAPEKGNYSLHVYDSNSNPTATYTLHGLTERSTILVNFHARNIGNGISMLSIRAVGHLPMITQSIVDTTWTEFSVSGILEPGGDLKLELFASVGGDNRALFDAISVYVVNTK